MDQMRIIRHNYIKHLNAYLTLYLNSNFKKLRKEGRFRYIRSAKKTEPCNKDCSIGLNIDYLFDDIYGKALSGIYGKNYLNNLAFQANIVSDILYLYESFIFLSLYMNAIAYHIIDSGIERVKSDFLLRGIAFNLTDKDNIKVIATEQGDIYHKYLSFGEKYRFDTIELFALFVHKVYPFILIDVVSTAINKLDFDLFYYGVDDKENIIEVRVEYIFRKSHFRPIYTKFYSFENNIRKAIFTLFSNILFGHKWFVSNKDIYDMNKFLLKALLDILDMFYVNINAMNKCIFRDNYDDLYSIFDDLVFIIQQLYTDFLLGEISELGEKTITDKVNEFLINNSLDFCGERSDVKKR